MISGKWWRKPNKAIQYKSATPIKPNHGTKAGAKRITNWKLEITNGEELCSLSLLTA